MDPKLREAAAQLVATKARKESADREIAALQATDARRYLHDHCTQVFKPTADCFGIFQSSLPACSLFYSCLRRDAEAVKREHVATLRWLLNDVYKAHEAAVANVRALSERNETNCENSYRAGFALKTVDLSRIGLRAEQLRLVSTLPFVERMDLSGNQLTFATGVLGETRFPSVQTLRLSNNRLRDLAMLEVFPNVVDVDVSTNLIEKLPRFDAPTLKRLKLSNNLLALGGVDVTGALEALETLWLDGNQLRWSDLTGFEPLVLRTLRTLDLRNNQIPTPEWVAYLNANRLAVPAAN
jgi:hypothetical protein